MFRCNSKSNCYANFSVFTLSFFHLSLWMGNEGFLDWHWFTHHNKRTLLWTLLTMDLVRDRGPCSSSGGAHRELGTPEDPGPGVSCSVIPSPCPVLMQTSSLDLSRSLCVVCFPQKRPQRAPVCCEPWVGREGEWAVGLGLLCLYHSILVQNSE